MPWPQEFDDPILLPDGRTLTTLEGASHFTAAPANISLSFPELSGLGWSFFRAVDCYVY